MQIDWPDYCRVHSRRTNLLLHLVAVPLFAGAMLLLLVSLLRAAWLNAALSIVPGAVALAAQGYGHRTETHAPRPFAGGIDFLRRWFTEQFYVFPAFFLSGRWWQQYRQADVPVVDES